MIKDDMTKLQLTFPKDLYKKLVIIVEEKRRKGYATKSTVIQEAFKEYLRCRGGE